MLLYVSPPSLLTRKESFQRNFLLLRVLEEALVLLYVFHGCLVQVAFLFQLIEKHPADAMSTGRSTALVLLWQGQKTHKVNQWRTDPTAGDTASQAKISDPWWPHWNGTPDHLRLTQVCVCVCALWLFGNDVYTGTSALLPHTGKTGHSEVVRVVYEPEKINFAQLLKVFWESHNPTQGNISFCHKIIS